MKPRAINITEPIWQGVQCVVFDLDGTLYNKQHLAWRMVLSDHRHLRFLQAERQSRHRLQGVYMGSEDAFYQAHFAHIATQCHCKVAVVEAWYKHTYMPNMIRILHTHYQAREEVQGLLQTLHAQGIRCAVYSDYGCVTEKLEAIGLHTADFEMITSAPEMGGLKPCKEAFQQLLTRLKVNAAQVLVVGDRNDTDGAVANAVGAKFYEVK